MTPRELTLQIRGWRWRAEQRQWQVAQIVAAIYDVQRNPKRRRKPITAEDVMGKRRRRGARTPEEQFEKFRQMTRLLGGTVRVGPSRR